jgi:SAM-dependent methyltransferase
VCLGSQLVPFLERDNVPAFQNVLYEYRTDALDVDRGMLRIHACQRCGFVFNAAFDPARTQYDRRYDNNQTCSAQFSEYLSGHIKRIGAHTGGKEGTIVEVGCGNGWFLERLVAASASSRGVGFDPAYSGPERPADGRIRYVRRYFEPGDAAVHADVVICRHVIEHVADPVALLTTVRAALVQSQNPRVFFETPDVEWILRKRVIWDFFYEHCSYFSPHSLRTGFQRAGFRVEQIENVFGGQYMWLEASVDAAQRSDDPHPGDTVALAVEFGRNEPALRAAWVERVKELDRSGKVAVWGAGAKGVTFVNVIDPDGSLVDCLVDISPDKQNLFVGGTGHPVIAPEQLSARGVTSAILMNPNYRDENLRLLASVGASIDLVDE